MKHVRRLCSALATAGTLLALSAQGQTDSTGVGSEYNPNALYEGPHRLNTWSVTVNAGSPQFFGDLRTYDFWPTPANSDRSVSERGAFGLGISVNKQLSHLFAVSLQGDFGTLKGTKYRLYNSYFTADFRQASLVGSTNIKSLLFGPRKLARWKVDLYAGLGVIWFQSEAYEIGTGRLKRFSNGDGSERFYGVKTDNTWTRELVLPVGLAINYELSPRFDVGLDIALHNVNTEKLDATVGGDYSSVYEGGGNIYDYRRGLSDPDKWGKLYLSVTYKLGRNAVKVGRDRDWDVSRGTYHLRYTDPRLLLRPTRVLTLDEIDSVARANRPPDIDPRLLVDTDNDGVSDYFDKQPNTPEGSIVSGAGVAIDFENVVNTLVPGAACLEVFANVLFETDRSLITPQYQELLARVVELLNKTQCRVQLTGHTDRRATDRYNMALAERRVQAVKKYLINAGVSNPNRIITDSFGSFKPIADNESPEGQRKNRRVEIRLLP
jgi:OOP family OmpA-OmpF porin